MRDVMYSFEVTSYCPHLIEVALPIREIFSESIRDKNIKGGINA